MVAKRYGPDVIWPEHQKQFWREALAKARQAGWTLHYLNAPHMFGVVSCPAGQHNFDVGKTPKSSEAYARRAERTIARCEHPPPGPLQDSRNRAGQLLDNAERITSEVADGLDKLEEQSAAYKLFDQVEARLKTAAANVSEVLRAEFEAALEEAIEADDAAPEPSDLKGELDGASEEVSEAEALAKPMRGGRPGVAEPLLRRARELHKRIDVLRSRLKALQEPE